jgi:hypothetical protein
MFHSDASVYINLSLYFKNNIKRIWNRYYYAPINVKPEGGGRAGEGGGGDLTTNAIPRVEHWLTDTSLRLGTFDKMLWSVGTWGDIWSQFVGAEVWSPNLRARGFLQDGGTTQGIKQIHVRFDVFAHARTHWTCTNCLPFLVILIKSSI